MKGTPTRGRFSPVIIRGTPLGLPTGKDLMEDEEAALKSLPRGTDLPYDDGEPMESPWHRNEMYLLIDSLATHWKVRDDVFIGGNMFVYFSDRQEFNRDFRGPDFFVVNGGVERHKKRVSWVAWEEGGRLPDLIIELVSPTTAKIDRGEKLKLYTKRFRVREYFCYDPATEKLQGWRRGSNDKTEPIEQEADGSMWSEELGLYLGLWDGVYLDHSGCWMRFFKPDDKLVLTDGESESAARRRAEAKAEAAEAELKRVKRELAALRKKRKNT